MNNNIETLENLFINFWFGSAENYNSWLDEATAYLDDHAWLPSWCKQWLALLPDLGVIICTLFLLLFLILLVRFFYHLTDLLNPSLKEVDTYSPPVSTETPGAKPFRRFRSFNRKKRNRQ